MAAPVLKSLASRSASSVCIALWLIPGPVQAGEPREGQGRCEPACDRSAILVPGSSHAMVAGPLTFSRGRGKPQTVSTEFSAEGFEGPFVLFLRNGTAEGHRRASSAQVRLNGVSIFGRSAFSKCAAGGHVPVAVPLHSVLEVTVAGAPESELTLWVAGNPRLQVELEEAAAVTRQLTTAGGTLCARAIDGTDLCLTLPEGALVEPREVTVTPIRAIPNLSLQGGFRAGVSLAPSGLQLARAAFLDVYSVGEPGSLVAFGYSDAGLRFHLQPWQRVPGGFRTSVSHFSGNGLASGTVADARQAVATAPPDSEESFSDQVTQIFLEASMEGSYSDEQIAALVAIHEAWYNTIVRSAFVDVFACAETGGCGKLGDVVVAALALHSKWWMSILMVGLDQHPAIVALSQSHEALIEANGGRLAAVLESRCIQAAAFCQKHSIYLDTLALAVPLQWLGYGALLEAFDADSWCGGLAKAVVNSVEIQPPQVEVEVFALPRALALVAKNHDQLELTNAQELAVSWDTADHGIAVVDRDSSGNPARAEIMGFEVGTTSLTASATQCDVPFSATATVSVVSKVHSIDLVPPNLTVEVGGDATVAVVLRDAQGQEVEARLAPVSLLPVAPRQCPPTNCRVGEVKVDLEVDQHNPALPYFAKVRGVRPGQVSIEASVEGSDAVGFLDVVVVAVPVSVELSPLSVTLPLGEQTWLDATVRMSDGTKGHGLSISWELNYDITRPAPVALDTSDDQPEALSIRGVQPGDATIIASVKTSAGVTLRSEPAVITVRQRFYEGQGGVRGVFCLTGTFGGCFQCYWNIEVQWALKADVQAHGTLVTGSNGWEVKTVFLVDVQHCTDPDTYASCVQETTNFCHSQEYTGPAGAGGPGGLWPPGSFACVPPGGAQAQCSGSADGTSWNGALRFKMSSAPFKEQWLEGDIRLPRVQQP